MGVLMELENGSQIKLYIHGSLGVLATGISQDSNPVLSFLIPSPPVVARRETLLLALVWVAHPTISVLLDGTSASTYTCVCPSILTFLRDATQVQAMSGTYDCDDAGNTGAQANAFFAVGQSSAGLYWCGPNGVRLICFQCFSISFQVNDLWGCGRNVNNNPMVDLTSINSGYTCGALNKVLSQDRVSNPNGWTLSSIYTEAGDVKKPYQSSGTHYGGVLCCKNVSSSCSAGTYSAPVMSGCADGTREWFKDRTVYPDIAGCSGGFSRPGIADSSFKSLTTRTCNSIAGNDSPNPTGTNCSSIGKTAPQILFFLIHLFQDLCEPGWKICETNADILVNSQTQFCNTESYSSPQFFASTLRLTSCTGSVNTLSTSGGPVGCGNVQTGAYCRQNEAYTMNSWVGTDCTKLNSSWSCPSTISNFWTQVTKSSADGGGVLCCRQRYSTCKSCVDGTCAAPQVPTITGISPSSATTSGSTWVTITGNYFGNLGYVTVNNQTCTRTQTGQWFSDQQIICSLPAGEGKNASFYVFSNVTGSGIANSALFSYAPPSITSIVSSNNTNGGTTVTINGINFGFSTSTINFTTGLCPEVVGTHSHTQLQCTLPSGQGSTVVYITAAGQRSSGFTFTYNPPSISSVSNQFASTSGGATIVISGSNFGQSGFVTFNGQNLSCPAWGDFGISCVLPAGYGQANLTVTVSGQVSNVASYQYGTPFLSFVSPLLGSTQDVSTLTVMLVGGNFGASSIPVSVYLNNSLLSASRVTHINHTHVQFKLDTTFFGVSTSVQLFVNSSQASCLGTCTFGMDIPRIISVSGCTNSAPFTYDCPASGGTTLTVTGYNFGNSSSGISVLVAGSSCGVTSFTYSNVSLIEWRFVVLCTMPAIPTGGRNLSVSVTVAGQTSSQPYLSVRGPSVVSNSIRLCGSSGSSNLTNVYSGQRLCFNVSNLDGATSSNVVVTYGSSSGDLNFSCSNVTVSDPVVSCTSAVGFGSYYVFTVKVFQQTAPTGSDMLSYVPVVLVNNSLRGDCSSCVGSNSFVATSNQGDWINFDVDNLVIGSLSSLWSNVQVIYGDQNSSSKAFSCSSISISNSSSNLNRSTIRCKTQVGRGTGYVFQVKAYNSLSAESVFTLSYPQVPVVTSIQGCTNSGNSTVNCSTAGQITLQVWGSNFCNFSSGNCTFDVSTGLNSCGNLKYYNASFFTCVLVASNGYNISMIITSTFSGGTVLTSEAVYYLSYAAPVISSVSGCNVGTQNYCSRSSYTQITISGTNFGASGATVLVNGRQCVNLTHDSTSPHQTVTCMTPPQDGLNLAVLLIQSSGVVSLNTGSISYQPCAAGTYSVGGVTTCTNCSLGTYIGSEGASSCLSCQAGYFANTTGLSKCSACLAGLFSQFGASQCSLCSNGTYSLSSASQYCVSCDLGKYVNTSGSTSCLLCQKGYFSSKSGSSTCQICGPGTFSSNDGSANCLQCSQGTASNVSGATSCSQCPRGSVPDLNSGDAGFTFCRSCSSGFYIDLPGQIACKQCPKGKYSDSSGSTTCYSCSSGTFSSQDGSSDCSSCTGGYFAAGLANVACSSCDIGRYSLSNASSCTDCPNGTFQSLPSQTYCHGCDLGSSNAFSGQVNCYQCCKLHFVVSFLNCIVDKGYIANQTGLANCVACQAGFYSDSFFTSCLNCSAGTYSLDAKSTCSSCDPGKFSNSSAASSCSLCPPGKFATNFSSTICSDCDVGKYSSSFGAVLCDACEVGTMANETGSSSCIPCDAGSYQSDRGQTYCLSCLPGSSINVPRSPYCDSCERGTYAADFGSITCSSCGNGTYQSETNATKCVDCDVGKYANVLKSTVCSMCSAGKYAVSTKASACDLCAAGQYQSDEGKTWCGVCSVGRYSVGGAQNCDLCPERTIINQTGAAACIACPQLSIANDARVDCLCNVGYYSNASSDEPSGKKCFKCPTGAACNALGITWDTLSTSQGYWRSSTQATEFYSCQFLSDCQGGRSSQCADNKVGPICALCEPGYTTFGNTCQECGSKSATVATFIVLVIVISFLVVGMYYVVLKFDKRQLRKFKKSMEMQEFMGDEHLDNFSLYDDENFEASSLDGTPQRPPNFAYKLKIVLGFFQISVGLAYSVNIQWPSLFKEVIAQFNIANFDIVQWTRVSCVFPSTDYIYKHLIVCLAPLILGSVVASGYLVPKYLRWFAAMAGGSEDSLKKSSLSLKRGIRKFWKMFLFTLFLLYPTVSSIVIRLYSCRTIEGVSYLVADFNIRCSSSRWFNAALYNVVFVVIYPIGILSMFAWILWENRDRLNEFECLIQFGFLYGDYNHDVWWFELVDMSHKLFMTSALALIPDDAVHAVALVVLGLHFIGLLWMNPYVRKGDDRLHLLCQGILFLYVLGGYVYGLASVYDSATDTMLSVLFIVMVVGIALYVIFQVVSVAMKLYKIRNNRIKKEAGAAAAIEVNVLAEYMLKEVRKDEAHYFRNPLYETGMKNAIMMTEVAPEPVPEKRPMEFVDAPGEMAVPTKAPLRVQFAPTQTKVGDDEKGL
jgi:hypothetical protein